VNSRALWILSFVALGTGCGESDGGSNTGSGTTGGSAGASSAGSETGGGSSAGSGTGGSSAAGSGAGGTSASGSGTGGGASGGSAGSSGAGSPFDGLMPKPDVDTTPVADCTGQPDLTLCETVTSPDRSYDICVRGVCVSPGCGDKSCNLPAPHFPIPPLSDHDYFVVAGTSDEPIVIDLVTGLHWQSCTSGTSGPNCAGTIERMTWDEAFAYCDDLTWGGKDDWYLPDSYELMSIFDFGKGALDPKLFPNSYSQYWTNHYGADSRLYALQFVGGAVGNIVIRADKTDDLAVRCARRGFSRDAGYVEKRFSHYLPGPSDEPVIEDASTGLVWQGCLSGHRGESCSRGSLKEFVTADWRPYCENLSWGGYDDWRLPTYKELFSILDFPREGTFSRPRVDDSVFDVRGVNYLPGTTGWGPNALDVLMDVEDGDRVGPGIAYAIMCVRWK
jgi:hypothetical protein